LEENHCVAGYHSEGKRTGLSPFELPEVCTGSFSRPGNATSTCLSLRLPHLANTHARFLRRTEACGALCQNAQTNARELERVAATQQQRRKRGFRQAPRNSKREAGSSNIHRSEAGSSNIHKECMLTPTCERRRYVSR